MLLSWEERKGGLWGLSEGAFLCAGWLGKWGDEFCIFLLLGTDTLLVSSGKRKLLLSALPRGQCLGDD
jgi:hypothetical protein